MRRSDRYPNPNSDPNPNLNPNPNPNPTPTPTPTPHQAYLDKSSQVADAKRAKTTAKAELRAALLQAEEQEAQVRASESALRAQLAEETKALAKAETVAKAAQGKYENMRDTLPPVPKSHDEEAFGQLSTAGQRTARHRSRAFLLAALRASAFRMDDVSWVLSKLGWIDEVMSTPEFARWFGEEVRTLLSHCQGSLWGTNLGLWAHLVEKIPLRTLRKFRQATECYEPDTDSWVQRILWENPHAPNDVVYVPYTVPAPCSFMDEIEEFSHSFGLHSSTDGKIAIQKLELLVPHVVTRDEGRGQPPLEYFENSATPWNLILQGDAARRGIKLFCQWVFKNPYLDSQSCLMLHLWALGLRVKDGQKGAQEAWGDEAEVLESLDGAMITVRGRRIHVSLSVTVDLCAERDLGGIINGGCMCQDFEQHHACPTNRRSRFVGNLPEILKYCELCREPTLAEQITLAHALHEDEELPRPCTAPGCDFGHGSQEKVRAEFSVAQHLYRKLAADAEGSDAGRDAFNKVVLDHAHRHCNVRWMHRGVPVPKVPKSRFWLELLHTIPLNACKLQVKHVWLKYLPEDLQDESRRLFRSWGVPIDMRPAGKRLEEKWPGGGVVKYLVDGGNGHSPGFAVVGAKLTWIVAKYFLAEKKKREADATAAAAAAAQVRSGSTTVAEAKAMEVNLFAKPSRKGKSAAALPLQPPAQTAARKPPRAEANLKDYETIPLESQASVDLADVAAIKQHFGPYLGQRVLSTLLSADTFRVAWVTAYKKLPYPTPEADKQQHAERWFLAWADWIEAIERVADHSFKSWVPHRILFKGTRQIAQDGDLWCKSTSALEMNQSQIGRTLDKVSCRRVSIDADDASTTRLVALKGEDGKETGEVRSESFKATKSMAFSAARHYVAAQNYLRDEDSILTRDSKRLLEGDLARVTSGRTTAKFVKLAVDPNTTSVKEFIKLMRADI